MGSTGLNSPDRTVVVAVYGQPEQPVNTEGQNISPDPSPDYDASDELEHGIDWFPWILRGINPAPIHRNSVRAQRVWRW
jgi:hypothetical protein